MIAAAFGWLLKIASRGVIKNVMGYFSQRSSDEATENGQNTKAATDIVVAEMNAELEIRKDRDKLAQPHDKLVSWLGGFFVLHVGMMTLDTCFHLGWKIGPLPGAFGQYEIQFLMFLIGAGTVLSLGKTIVSRVWK